MSSWLRRIVVALGGPRTAYEAERLCTAAAGAGMQTPVGQAQELPSAREDPARTLVGESPRASATKPTNSADRQRDRIVQLVELACIARGWTRAKLASHLGRDVSRLVPDEGNPRLDYVMRLADVLEWPIGEVARAIREPLVGDDGASTTSYEQAMEMARGAIAKSDYRAAIAGSRAAQAKARSANEQAIAISHEASYLNKLGHHREAVEVATRGLAIGPLCALTRLRLQLCMVHGLAAMHQFSLALPCATMLLQQSPSVAEQDVSALALTAFAAYWKAYCHQRLSAIEEDRRREHLDEALRCYTIAKREFLQAAAASHQRELVSMGSICDAGLLECEVETGQCAAAVALSSVTQRVGMPLDSKGLEIHELEAIGWWAIAGASIASRHLQKVDRDRSVAVFAEKALEVADHCNNKCMRDRVLAIQCSTPWALGDQYQLDIEDRHLIIAHMSCFSNLEVGRTLDWWRLSRAGFAALRRESTKE